MSKREPIPTPEYRIPLDNHFVSCGGTYIYQVVSGMVCRIYWDGDKPTPNSNESAWYDTGTEKGWRRDGANFPSYLVQQLDLDYYLDTEVLQYFDPIYITVRHKPNHTNNLYQLLGQVIKTKYQYQNSPVRPIVKPLDDKIVNRVLAPI